MQNLLPSIFYNKVEIIKVLIVCQLFFVNNSIPASIVWVICRHLILAWAVNRSLLLLNFLTINQVDDIINNTNLCHFQLGIFVSLKSTLLLFRLCVWTTTHFRTYYIVEWWNWKTSLNKNSFFESFFIFNFFFLYSIQHNPFMNKLFISFRLYNSISAVYFVFSFFLSLLCCWWIIFVNLL